MLPFLFLYFFLFKFHISSQGDGLGTVTKKNAGVIKNQYKFLEREPVIGSYAFFDMDSGMCSRYNTMHADLRHLTGRISLGAYG